MIELEWTKCKGGIWCELNKLDLDHKLLQGLHGVYVLWSGRGDRSILRVGSGKIADELKKNMRELAVIAFFSHGVFVSWAETPLLKTKSIQSYLAMRLNPKIDDGQSNATPIDCNLPWDPVPTI